MRTKATFLLICSELLLIRYSLFRALFLHCTLWVHSSDSVTPIITVVLQEVSAVAAARIEGKIDIFKAARVGDLQLVQDHVAADPASVHKRDE
jgi:hypothetical protein